MSQSFLLQHTLFHTYKSIDKSILREILLLHTSSKKTEFTSKYCFLLSPRPQEKKKIGRNFTPYFQIFFRGMYQPKYS